MFRLKHIFVAFVLILSTPLFAQESDSVEMDSTAITLDKINWMTLEEALEANENEPRMMFFDMYTDWCGWCKRMDATTFKDSLIIDYLNDNYYAIKFDAEQKEDVEVKGRTYKFVPSGRRGYHELAAELMSGKLSYPTYVFLNSDLTIFTQVPGYKPEKDLLPILEFCVNYDTEEPTDWQTFIENYDSPYAPTED